MKEYFKLQYIMIKRKLADGYSPFICCLFALLVVVVFLGLSIFLFHKIIFASYIYVFISLFLTAKLSEIKRNDFLKICFKKEQYIKIRILENLIIALPFVIFLIFKQQFYPTVMLVIITVLLALLNFKTSYSITIPTPFYKKPFEFTVGFRNTFFIFFIAYCLTVISITVDNFNLGIFALILVFLTVSGYYSIPENEYYVWSYSLKPAKFLIEKIKTAFIFTFYLCCPILILLGIFNFGNIANLFLVTVLGFLFLLTVILAKYSAYPKEISLVETIMIILCLIFPPLLIFVIPFFAKKSIHKLGRFLR